MPASSSSTVVDVEGKHLSLSNLDKVLYPATGFTKGQVIDYYARYEKNAPKHRPDWVQTAPIWSRHNRRHINFLKVEDLPTLIWLANLASLEIHPSLALATDIDGPTMIVFDLDPGPPANILQGAQVGLWVRDIFKHFGLESFPKTSGATWRGCPLSRGRTRWPTAPRSSSRAIGWEWVGVGWVFG